MKNKEADHDELLRIVSHLSIFLPKPAVHVSLYIQHLSVQIEVPRKPLEMKENISAIPTSIALYCSLFEQLIMVIYVINIHITFVKL